MSHENNETIHPIDNTQSKADNTVVTPKTIDIFSAFAVTLKQIHVRLIAEGYIIKEGRLIKSERMLQYEEDSKSHRKNRRSA